LQIGQVKRLGDHGHLAIADRLAAIGRHRGPGDAARRQFVAERKARIPGDMELENGEVDRLARHKLACLRQRGGRAEHAVAHVLEGAGQKLRHLWLVIQHKYPVAHGACPIAPARLVNV
jgi:hypothetical protein